MGLSHIGHLPFHARAAKAQSPQFKRSIARSLRLRGGNPTPAAHTSSGRCYQQLALDSVVVMVLRGTRGYLQ
jgi:hypothetical protein